MDWYDIALRVTALGGILTMLATVAVIIRGAFNAARIKELSENNLELRADIADHERREAAYRLKVEACEIVSQGLTEEVDRLTQLVLQRADVEGVKAEVSRLLLGMKEHHDEAMTQWEHMNSALQALLEQKMGDNDDHTD